MTGTALTTRLAALALTLAAGAAAASTMRLMPERFREISQGSTLVYAVDGSQDAFYGAEQYLEDGQVIWQDASGRCVEGEWVARGPDLCFTYTDDPLLTLCWGFYKDEDGLFARLVGSPQDDRLRVVARTQQPLTCQPPDAGV